MAKSTYQLLLSADRRYFRELRMVSIPQDGHGDPVLRTCSNALARAASQRDRVSLVGRRSRMTVTVHQFARRRARAGERRAVGPHLIAHRAICPLPRGERVIFNANSAP